MERENLIVTHLLFWDCRFNIFESFFLFLFFPFPRKFQDPRSIVNVEFISYAHVVVVIAVASNFALRFIDSLFNPNCNLFLLTGFSRECATILEVKLRIAKWKHVLNGNA